MDPTNDQPKHLILVGLSGSWAHGTYHTGYLDPDSGEPVPASDLDLIGVYVTPTQEILGFDPPPEWQNGKEADVRFDEVKRFMGLCLNGDSRCLELLATVRKGPTLSRHPNDPTPVVPCFEGSNLMGLTSYWGNELVRGQEVFHSKKLLDSYAYYMDRQLQRMNSQQKRRSRPAMHLIRIALTALRLIKTGTLDPDVKAHRHALHAIRTGQTSFDEVRAWYAELRAEFDALAPRADLPAEPDRKLVTQWLMAIRQQH